MLKKIAVALAAGLVLGASMTAAQTTNTLRGLAPEDLYIGAAVSVPSLRNDPTYVETLTREFNLVTPENVMKMETIQPQRGVFDFTPSRRTGRLRRSERDGGSRAHTGLAQSASRLVRELATSPVTRRSNCCATTSTR